MQLLQVLMSVTCGQAEMSILMCEDLPHIRTSSTQSHRAQTATRMVSTQIRPLQSVTVVAVRVTPETETVVLRNNVAVFIGPLLHVTVRQKRVVIWSMAV